MIPTPVIMRNCQKMLSLHNKILRKNDFVETVCPPNVAVFVYVSTHYVETTKSLYCRRYKSWLGGLSVTHQTSVHEEPGSIPASGKDFCLFAFCFCCCCDFTLFCQNTWYMKLCNSFCNIILLFILSILQNW